MPSPPLRALIFVLAFLAPFAPLSGFSQGVFINEIHYDNSGGDSGEFVEVAGPAGTDLGGYSLVFYNGSDGGVYKTEDLFGVIPSEAGSGFGALAFPISGIQNGAPDAVALVGGSGLVQLLSYEGSFVAVGGVADGEVAVDIGVAETGATAVGQSLQLAGTGGGYADFVWGGPAVASPGAINAGQEFVGDGVPSITLSVSPDQFFEAAGGAAATGTLFLNPPPAVAIAIALGSDPAGQLVLPATVEVGPAGSATFTFGALEDGVSDGAQAVALSATDPTGGYAAGAAAVTVLDSDPPEGRGVAYRVAAYNVKNGVGSPGSAQYAAVLAVLRRLGADFIAFSEVNSGADFGDLRALLTELGMAVDAAHLATAGDAFADVDFRSGVFGSGAQSLAFASRWPIVEAVQIGRGDAGRAELARYPLFVQVDIPGDAADPVFVAVHLKAGNMDSDNFRRTVEGWRINEFLDGRGLSGAADNVFLLGDFNEDDDDPAPATYTTDIDTAFHVFGDGSTLPGSYLLGADLAPPNGRVIGYAGFPDTAFPGVAAVGALQLDGVRRTFNLGGDARIDYILTGAATLANAPPMAEVYNSLLEGGYDGLPKVGSAPGGGASLAASDHHPVFGDFALAAAPVIALGIAADGGLIVGALSISPAPAVAVEVELLADRGRLALPATVTVGAGGGPVFFPIVLGQSGAVAAEALLRVTGQAPGHVSGHGYLAATGGGPSGLVLFSGYVEAPSGAAPRAVEVVNNSGGGLDFAVTPLRLAVGNNGAAPVAVLTVATGTLADGEVLVIGGDAAGEFLVGEGLLAPPAGGFGFYLDGAPFPDGDGRLGFVKKVLPFNGDDSLQLRLGFVLADTFGQPGQDPGAAWTGGGVSTANQNLRLRDDVATPSAGFGDPSSRFVTVAEGGLSGFGDAPARDDPYAVWAAGFGLAGVEAAPVQDLEPDGWNGLLEYAFGGHPEQADYGGAAAPGAIELAGQIYPTLRHLRRAAPGRLSYAVESSADGQAWTPAPTVVEGSAEPEGDGMERVTLRLLAPLPPGGALLLRLRVLLP